MKQKTKILTSFSLFFLVTALCCCSSNTFNCTEHIKNNKNIKFHYIDNHIYKNDTECLNYGYNRLKYYQNKNEQIDIIISKYGLPNYTYEHSTDSVNKFELYYHKDQIVYLFEKNSESKSNYQLVGTRKITPYEDSIYSGLIMDRIPKLELYNHSVRN